MAGAAVPRNLSLTKSGAQIEAFDDTWHWTDAAEEAFGDVLRSGNGAAAEMLRAMRSFLGENDMMAYLAMMAVRLLELHPGQALRWRHSAPSHLSPVAGGYDTAPLKPCLRTSHEKESRP